MDLAESAQDLMVRATSKLKVAGKKGGRFIYGAAPPA